MKKMSRADQQGVEAALQTSDFRGATNDPNGDANPAIQRRVRTVRRNILNHIDDPAAPTAAAALVAIDIAGRVKLMASGIEPEMAARVAEGLRDLADRIDRFGAPRTAPMHNQRGVGTLGAIATIAIAAASYINEVAWVDVALTLASHALGAYLSRKPRR
ncbi:hypothetical protein [Burkholderia gladioli]|uniref:hypothetical protein n=1 Tax=Burkholderia gladioli TaxID=28095 RepID=UPI0010574B3C|nr:hypothetical protein [Burkholderia gladioli]